MRIVWEDVRLENILRRWINAAHDSYHAEIGIEEQTADMSGPTTRLSWTNSGTGPYYKAEVGDSWLIFCIDDDNELLTSSNIEGFTNPPIKPKESQ